MKTPTALPMTENINEIDAEKPTAANNIRKVINPPNPESGYTKQPKFLGSELDTDIRLRLRQVFSE